MTVKYKTLFFVRSSLISLYLALTIPIPFIANDKSVLLSITLFLLGLLMIVNITSDYVEICDEKITYKTSFFSKLFGKKTWEIFLKDIVSIKAFPTSQGSNVYYFITDENKNFLVPQRIENFEEFISKISKKTNLNLDGISYISPLWTYKLLTFLSFIMITGELFSFLN